MGQWPFSQNGMRIIHVSSSPNGQRQRLLLLLTALLALGLAAAAAGMESSAELQALQLPVSETQQRAAFSGNGLKVKRRQRLNSHSNLPTITANTALAANLSSWQQQRYLKVNQVFESERRMSHAEIQRNHGKIVLLGLFELSTKRGPRPDGLSELGAATMAVEHINRKQLLPGYTLELVTNDTQVSVAHSWVRLSITKLKFHLVARATLKLNKKNLQAQQQQQQGASS